MANFLYAAARTKFLWGGLGWTTNAASYNFHVAFLTNVGAIGISGIGTTGWPGSGASLGSSYSPSLGDIDNNQTIYSVIPTRIRATASAAAAGITYLDSQFWRDPVTDATVTWGAGADTIATVSSGLGYTIDGEARMPNIKWASVPATTGGIATSQLQAFVVYQKSPFFTGTAAQAMNTSQLIAYFDTATNLPIYANGGDITIQWSTSPNYVFKL